MPVILQATQVYQRLLATPTGSVRGQTSWEPVGCMQSAIRSHATLVVWAVFCIVHQVRTVRCQLQAVGYQRLMPQLQQSCSMQPWGP